MRKKIIVACLSLALVATVAIGGTLAYFTDKDQVTNVFTVGKVDIELRENFEQDSLLMPGSQESGTVKKEVFVDCSEDSQPTYVRVHIAIPKDVIHGRGYVYSLQYHIVWVTKYRKPIFVGTIEQDVKNYLIETLKSLDMDVLAMEIMPDYIHLLVNCKPQLRLSDAVKILKGNTARWLFLSHPEIKKQLWGGHLWNPSYFVATVSDRTLEQVKTYIDNQKTK